MRSQRQARVLVGLGPFFMVSSLILLLTGSGLYAADGRAEAQAHADSGLQLARSGDLPSAEAELRQAVTLEPRNPEFLSTLGTLLAIDHKLEESTTVFRKALQLVPRDLTVRRYLAANLWQLHRYSEAKQQLQILLQQQPNDAASRLLRGMVAENTQDYPTAAKMLSSVPDEVAKRPESIAALARSYYHLGQPEKARNTLAELSTPAAGVQGVLLGAEIADEAGDFDAAEKLLESVRLSSSNPAAVGYRLALVQYHASRFAESQSTLQNLIDSGSQTSQIYNLLGWCYHKQKQPKQAVDSLEQAIRIAPTQESNYLDLEKILLAYGPLSAALDFAKRAAVGLPNSAKIWEFKGEIESRMSQYTDAVSSYQHAIELDQSDTDGRLGLARAQVSAGLNSDAASTLDAAMKRFPKDARFKVDYAAMLVKQAEAGDPHAKIRAEEMLRSAIAIDRSLPQAHYELGNLELNDGRMTEACWQLEQAVKFAPQSSQAHFALARAYRRLKRAEDAAREMDLYQKLKGTDSRSPDAGLVSDEAEKRR